MFSSLNTFWLWIFLLFDFLQVWRFPALHWAFTRILARTRICRHAMRTHVHPRIWTDVDTNTRANAQFRAHTLELIHMQLCVHSHTCSHAYTYIHAGTNNCMHTQSHTRAYAHANIYDIYFPYWKSRVPYVTFNEFILVLIVAGTLQLWVSCQPLLFLLVLRNLPIICEKERFYIWHFLFYYSHPLRRTVST